MKFKVFKSLKLFYLNKAMFYFLIALFSIFFTTYSYSADTVKVPTRTFINPSFESPTVTGSTFVLDTGVPGWITSETDHYIEIWASGFNGVTSQNGSQHAELNANTSSRLYQNICFIPGDPTATLSFAHRARVGTDKMRLYINNVGQTPDYTDTTSAWGTYTKTYTPSVSQATAIQIGFESISTGSGDNSVGNFLDNITLTGLAAFFELENSTASATESTTNPTIRIRINGYLASAQTINLTTSGTAVNGTDYTLPSTVNVPAGYYDGTTYISIPLVIINNNIPQPNRTIGISVSTSAALTIFKTGPTLCQTTAPNTSITYTIIDDDKADFGDAPDTYGTTLANNGAFHIPSSSLKLRTNSGDLESDGQPSTNADGDDNNGTDDEDGVTSFSAINTSSTSYNISVKATNSKASAANMIGWIDFNKDGIFQSSEASGIVNVSSGTNNGTFTLSWSSIPTNITSGTSYVRIRLTTDSMTTSDSTGYKSDGEVEDYPLTISPSKISGNIFEDKNYGGGAGRNKANASGLNISNAKVELYSSSGTLSSSTTTDSSGNYSFTNVAGGTYTVRVVNTSVRSTRPGNTGSEIPVQTFRTNASSGTAVDVTDHVGGEVPEKIDAAANSGSQNLSVLTTSTATPQSITTVTIGSSDVTGVDFGFNFDTIVNTKNSGQGSLSQFINNSNALTNSGLAQVGQTSGQEVSIFMIPNGVANPGQNTSYTNQLSTYGAAVINIGSSALPAVTDSNTSIDGATQTNNVKTAGNAQTNSGQVGSGGLVGVSQTRIEKFNNPEVEIQANNIRALTSNNTATGFQLKNMAFSKATVYLGNNSLAQDNLVGMHADGTETGSTSTNDYAIRIGDNTSNVTVRHNYVKTDNSAIRRDTGGSNMLVEFNEVDSPATEQSDTYDGILLIGAGNYDTFQYNLIHNIKGSGSELGYTGADVYNLVIQENTYDNNGKLKNGNPSTEPMNLDVRNINSGSIIKIYRNIISNAGGMGILVDATKRVWITQNSIFSNGKVAGKANLGIDLYDVDVDPNTLGNNLNGVNGNDGITNSSKANSGTDYPIVTLATISGTTLRIQGYVGSAPGQTAFANATVEFFRAADDGNNNGEILAGDGKSVPHGEGKDFVGSCQTGSDGSFDCSFYNINGIVPGDLLTATATNSNFDTSEFSNLTVVTQGYFIFTPSNSSNADPGATIYYTHKVISSIDGNVNLVATTDKGWAYTIFNDVNNNGILDSSDTMYSTGTSISLGNVYSANPAHTINLIVKVQIPTNTPQNTTDNFKITATLTPTSSFVTGVSIIVNDVTTVSNQSSGVLKLVKTVDKTSAKPGDTLTYTITYTNNGNFTLNNIVISDIVPEGTTYVSSTNSGVYTPATKKIDWTIPSTLPPGGSGIVSFTITLN